MPRLVHNASPVQRGGVGACVVGLHACGHLEVLLLEEVRQRLVVQRPPLLLRGHRRRVLDGGEA